MRAKTKNYKDLLVWQKARLFIKQIYKITKSFPKDELFGLTSQIRRAVISISANIAEGYARTTRKEYAQFINVAFASATELEALLIAAYDLDYISRASANLMKPNLQEILRMLNKLRQTLRHANPNA